MVVGAALKRRTEGGIGATREVYIRQCSVQGCGAHEVVQGILPAFLTTITIPAMHDNDRSSRADDLQISSVSSIITIPAAPDPGYPVRLPIPATDSSYPFWPSDFPMFFSLASASMATLLTCIHDSYSRTKQDKARRKPSSPAFNKRRGCPHSRHSLVSPCT